MSIKSKLILVIVTMTMCSCYTAVYSDYPVYPSKPPPPKYHSTNIPYIKEAPELSPTDTLYYTITDGNYTSTAIFGTAAKLADSLNYDCVRYLTFDSFSASEKEKGLSTFKTNQILFDFHRAQNCKALQHTKWSSRVIYNDVAIANLDSLHSLKSRLNARMEELYEEELAASQEPVDWKTVKTGEEINVPVTLITFVTGTILTITLLISMSDDSDP